MTIPAKPGPDSKHPITSRGVVSRAQNRFMRACAGQKGLDGCPPADVVERFIEATHGKRVRDYPEHVVDGAAWRGRFPDRWKAKL